MRRLATILAIAMIAAASPLPARARYTYVMSVKPKGQNAYASCPPAQGAAGHCGGLSGFLGWKQRSLQVTNQDHIFTPIMSECQPPPTRGGKHQGALSQCLRRMTTPLSQRIHHIPSHCITCFQTGQFCECCCHDLTRIEKPSPSFYFYAGLFRLGIIDAHPHPAP
jgi:hypothetical protein